MFANSETPPEPKPHQDEEYQDPLYEDDDEVVPDEDAEPHPLAPAVAAGKRKPSRRIPPPPRRFYED